LNDIVVRCTGLSKWFGLTQAVGDLDLALEHGKTLALLGPSGSGKTTTLRLIAGFEVPSTGSVEIGGRIVAMAGIFVPPEKRRVGMVFQDYALFPHLTVLANIGFGLSRDSQREDRIEEVLDLTGLSRLRSRMPHQLSGGQQQRVALARAMAPRPQVLLLDEPFSNLDPALRSQVREEVRNILKAGLVTAMLVTHDQEEALFMGDVIAIQNGGSIEQVDTPEGIYNQPTTKFAASFMGLANFLPARLEGEALWTEVGVASLPDTLSSYEGLEVMARPDCVLLHPTQSGLGTIADRVFQGDTYLYKVVLNSGTVIHAVRPHIERYLVGERVDVTFCPDHKLLCFVDGQIVNSEPSS
jgi:iron(III) transport system ATP-binding protein